MTGSMTQQLAIDYPIIQAPMAGISTPELAAAVSNAGGLGSLGIGASSVSQARAAIAKTRELTSRPFNVNLFCHPAAQRDSEQEKAWIDYLRPHFARFDAEPPHRLSEIYQSFIGHDEMLDMLLTAPPPVVSFHFGLPEAAVIDALKNRNIVTLATATCLADAQKIAAAGIDILIAQGYEAGGHRGSFNDDAGDRQLSTQALVSLLKAHIPIPLIAAGGIMTGQDIRQMLTLGADGVQLGSAFLLCPESATDAGYRARLSAKPAKQTVMTRAISGRSARCIDNHYCRLGQEADRATVPAYPVAYDAGKALASAAKANGEHGYSAHWAGQGISRIRQMPAAALLHTLVREAGL